MTTFCGKAGAAVATLTVGLGFTGPYCSGPSPCRAQPDTFSCWELFWRRLPGDGEGEEEDDDEEEEGDLFLERLDDFRLFSRFFPRLDKVRFFFLRRSSELEEDDDDDDDDIDEELYRLFFF